MTVQYALNTSTIRPASLMEKIRIAGQTGYQGIELWNDDLTAHEQQGGSCADVRQALADYGLAVPTVIAVHGWLGAEGAARAQALEEVRRRMAQAVAVGAEFIVASPPLDNLQFEPGRCRLPRIAGDWQRNRRAAGYGVPRLCTKRVYY